MSIPKLPWWAWLLIVVAILIVGILAYRQFRKMRVAGQISKAAGNKDDVSSSFASEEVKRLASECSTVFTSWGGAKWVPFVESDKDKLANKLLGLSNSELALLNNYYNVTFAKQDGYSFFELIDAQTSGWSISGDTKEELLEKLADANITR